MKMDTSTIDMTRLNRLPLYKKPETYQISDSYGMGCAGDPPGYPSYFLQSVYTSHGNTPSKGAQTLLLGRVVAKDHDLYNKLPELLRKLWKPLPYEHERVQAWIADKYRHMANCYYHPSYVDRNGEMVILTPPSYYSEHFKTKSFHDDIRFSEAWRVQAKAEVEAYNAEVYKKWEEVCKPENYAAYIIIKGFYPEHEPNLEYIANPPKEIVTWWEVYDHKPSPEECPGNARWGRSNTKHPANITWCQVCGWKPEVIEAAVK